MIDAYPLQWPVGRARADSWSRKGDPFHVPGGKIRSDLARELRLMGVDDFVISTNLMVRNDGLPYANQKAPDDPGVALYFTRKGRELCIACDQYEKIDANLRAIGKTLEAIRGIERWGTEDMVDAAFTGFAALPESVIVTPYTSENWWDVLEVRADASQETVRAAYKAHLFKAHPDQGGSTEQFTRIQNAFKQSGVS